MRTTIRWLPAAALAALLAGGDRAAAQDGDKAARTIVATGSGSVKVKADGARISFGVRTSGPSFALARDENQKLTKGLLEAIDGLKLDGVKVTAATPDVTIADATQLGAIMVARSEEHTS